MALSPRTISLGFTEQEFPAGTHMCLIYSDDAERRSLVSRFLGAGLECGDQVSYFADSASPDEVSDWLAQRGLEIPPEASGNQLSILDAEETYCPEGRFDPDPMLDKLRGNYTLARESGYRGSRVCGEMAWALRGIPGSERLIEYEAKVNLVVTEHPVTAICQYDANLFDGATILDVLLVHPMMVVHGQVVENPYYVRPEEFLDQIGANGRIGSSDG